MKTPLLFFFSLLTYVSVGQDCTVFTNSTQLDKKSLRFTALNDGEKFNSLDLKKSSGPDGGTTLAEYVSLIYSSNIWAGGYDNDNNLRVSSGTYANSGTINDWSPGPLLATGEPLTDGCELWDRTFDIKKNDVRAAYHLLYDGCTLKSDVDCDALPENIKMWPARGNEFLFDGLGEDVKLQQYGQFFDENGNGLYEPCLGDFPIIFVTGCEAGFGCSADFLRVVPEQFSYWITNDNSNAPFASSGSPMKLEVHNYAIFNNVTNAFIQGNQDVKWFYNIVNKGQSTLRDFRFSLWVDYDLGCPEDDYAGVDNNRKSVFVYNEDSVDGGQGSSCPGSVASFDDEEISGFTIDMFRGLIQNDGEALTMTSAVFPNYSDPINTDQARYNVMSGFQYDGADILDPNGNPTKFMYDGNPSDDEAWSMCNLSNTDPLFSVNAIMSTGPIELLPGQRNEVQVAISHGKTRDLPCPDLKVLQFHNDISQASYDNCLNEIVGPSAPNIDVTSNGNSFDLIMNNEYLISNNKNQSYREPNQTAPGPDDTSDYKFEGYKIYQVATADFDLGNIDDLELSRVVFQADLANGIGAISDYEINPNSDDYFDGDFVVKVQGADLGIPEKFTVDYDYLYNIPLSVGSEYHYIAIAYGFSNIDPYDEASMQGNRKRYVESSYNIKVTTVQLTTTSTNEEIADQWKINIGINSVDVSEINTDLEIDCYNISGQVVKSWSLNQNATLQYNAQGDNLPSGMYFLRATDSNTRKAVTYKFQIAN